MTVKFEGGEEMELTPDQIFRFAGIKSVPSTYEVRKGFATEIDEGHMLSMLSDCDKKALSITYTYVCEDEDGVSFHYLDGVLFAASRGIHYIVDRSIRTRWDPPASAPEAEVKKWLLKKMGALAKSVAEEADMMFQSHDAIEHIPIG